MADMQKNTNSVIAWLGLIVGGLALLISIVAYNRSGEDLDDTVVNRTAAVVDEAEDVTEQAREEIIEARNEISESAEQLRLRTEIGARIVAIQAQVTADNVTDETVTEIQDLRSDLRNAYADATGEMRTQVDQLDQDLERLETEVREDTAAALATIENLLARLRRETLTDEDDVDTN